MNTLLQKVKRSSPKKGRRAPITTTSTDSANEDHGILGDLGIKSHPEKDDSDAPPKPPRRKTGGWGDANAKSAKGRTVTTNHDDDISDNEANEKDIKTIPDLDDFQEEDNAVQVAKAPSIAVNRVVTYKELDGDLLKQSTFTTLDDINVKVLSKFLSPESEIQEDQVLWTWDILLADMSSQLNQELPSQSDNEK